MQIKKIFTFGLYFCLFLVASCLIAPAFAQIPSPTKLLLQMLRISPVIIDLPLSPGKTFEETITVENLLDTPLPLRATTSDFESATEDGGYLFEETRTNPLLSWLAIEPKELIVPAKTKEKISLTIKTPLKIPVGGYYGIIFFEPVFSAHTVETTKISARVGVLVLSSVGVIDPRAKKAEILNFSLPLVSQGTQLPLLLRIKNISLHHFSAKPLLTLEPLFGEKQEIALEEKFVFPAKVRRWQQKIQLQNKYPNFYKATLAVSIGNGQQILGDSILVVFPVAKAVLAILIVVIAVILTKSRNRIKKALRAFLHG